MDFINWCNANQGFLSLLLAIFTALISILAIIISILTARLPYKKKVKITNNYKLAIAQTAMGNLSTTYLTVGVVNVGNRTVSTDYVGLGFYKDKSLQRVYPASRALNCKTKLNPSQLFEVNFMAEEILKLQNIVSPDAMIYSVVIDTEGQVTKKRFGYLRNIINAIK